MSEGTNNPVELAADIVSAFVSNNSVPASELPALIGTVHDADFGSLVIRQPLGTNEDDSLALIDGEVRERGLQVLIVEFGLLLWGRT